MSCRLTEGKMLGISHYGRNCSRRRSAGTAASWAVEFENLLGDPVGLKNFTDFLKREFSEENITFWMICEQYRELKDRNELIQLAKKIYNRYLCQGAAEPVNVDSSARQVAKTGLDSANVEIFSSAQKQIFNLMKFDCYQRYLKSDLYAACLKQELLKREESKRSRSKSRDRLKIKEKMKIITKEKAEEKQRKSLLPWQKGKLELDNDGASSLENRNPDLESLKKRQRDREENKAVLKIYTNQNQEVSSDIQDNCSSPELSSLPGNSDGNYLKVILSDQSSTVVKTRPGDTVGWVVFNMLSKRGLKYTAFDIYCKDKNEQLLDHNITVADMGDKEINVTQRVLFRVQLPCKKVVAVKAKLTQTWGEVMEPIVKKYGFQMENIFFTMFGSQRRILSHTLVHIVDGQKAIVHQIPRDLESVEIRHHHKDRLDVTTQIFHDLSHGTSSLHFDEFGLLDMEQVKNNSLTSEKSRRNSLNLNKEDKLRTRPVYSGRASIHEGMGVRIQLPDTHHRKPISCRDSTDLSKLWIRAQARMDDQRGTEINCELPDFLKLC